MVARISSISSWAGHGFIDYIRNPKFTVSLIINLINPWKFKSIGLLFLTMLKIALNRAQAQGWNHSTQLNSYEIFGYKYEEGNSESGEIMDTIQRKIINL